MVQILDALVQQTVDQLVEVLSPFDTHCARAGDRRVQDHFPRRHPAARCALREPQLPEQLVDVQTRPGYAFAVVAVRRDARQIVQKSVEILQVQFLDWLGHPLLYNDRCLGLTVQKTVEVPQLQYSDRVVDVPAVAVHRQGLDVPVISQ